MGVCVYIGGWSQICGHSQLGASWLGDGQSVVAAITTEPLAFFRGAVTSATTATLTDWATQQDFSDAQPLSGSLELSGDGRLLISPTEPPFSIDECNFDMYSGAFNGVQGPGRGAAGPSP
jgi:hypothetical protein